MSSTTTIADVATIIEGINDNGAVSGTISTSGGTYTIPTGYHNGSGKVTGPTLAALIGTNVTLASAANLLTGYTAYGKNGIKYTGTNKGYDAGVSAGKIATNTYTLAGNYKWVNEDINGKSISYNATSAGKFIFIGIYAAHHNNSETPADFEVSGGTKKNIYHQTNNSGVMRSRVLICEIIMSSAGTISCTYNNGAAEHHYAFLYLGLVALT